MSYEGVRIGKEEKRKLIAYAQSKKIAMSVILNTFIEQGIEYDIFDPDWARKVQAFSDREDRYLDEDKFCPALVAGEEYLCVWGRKGRPPEIKKLGVCMDKQRDICDRCTRTRKIDDLKEHYEAQIKAMQDKLNLRQIIEIPSCERGGKISEDGKELYCNQYGDYKNVESFCKKLRSGSSCQHLRKTFLSISGSLDDVGDNR